MFRSETAMESDNEFHFVSAVLGPSVTVSRSKSRYSVCVNRLQRTNNRQKQCSHDCFCVRLSLHVLIIWLIVPLKWA